MMIIGLSIWLLCSRRMGQDNWYWSRVKAWGYKVGCLLYQDANWVSDTDVV